MKIRIRKYKNTDVGPFYEAVRESLAALCIWLPWAHKDYAISESTNWVQEIVPKIWREEKGCEFVILNMEESRVLGGCCLEQLDLTNKRANIGYWVRTSASGKGIATQACFFLLTYGFEELGLEEIRVIPSAENPASVKVAEKLPYLSKERVPNGFQIRDQVSDALLYTISRESFSTQGII